MRQRVLDASGHGGVVVRVHPTQHRCAQDFSACGRPNQLNGGGVGIQHLAGLVHHHAQWQAVEQCLVVVFAFLQQAVCLLAACNTGKCPSCGQHHSQRGQQ